MFYKMVFLKGHKINKGRIWSKDRNLKISKANLGRKFSKISCLKMSNTKKRLYEIVIN